MAAKKATTTTIKDWTTCDAAVAKLGEVRRLRETLTNEMNEELAAIRAGYADDISGLDARIATLERDIEAFCVQARADFGTAKSRELMHGTVAFRLTPPALATLNRKWTWAVVLETISNILKRPRWLRKKVEIDKEVIMSDYRNGKVSDSELARYGMRVAQKELFEIEPKGDDPAPVPA